MAQSVYYRTALCCIALTSGALWLQAQGSQITQGNSAAPPQGQNANAGSAKQPQSAPGKDHPTLDTTATDAATPSTTPTIGDVVRVDITPSRSLVSGVADAYTVDAELSNLTDRPIGLNASEIVLVVPAEASADKLCSFNIPASFPTNRWEGDNPPTVVIQPKDHYPVVFDVNRANTRTTDEKDSCHGTWFHNNVVSLLGFVPGKYRFTITGKAYQFPANGPSTYRTFTQTAEINVQQSQMSTLLATFVGGMLAFFLEVRRGKAKLYSVGYPDGPVTPVQRFLRSALPMGAATGQFLGAGIMSASVAIIASRLSETSLPIKVSVTDFWGALTLGFVAYYMANKILDWLSSLGAGKGAGAKAQGGDDQRANANAQNAAATEPAEPNA